MAPGGGAARQVFVSPFAIGRAVALSERRGDSLRGGGPAARAAWRAAGAGGRRGRARTTGGSGSTAAGCATPSTTTTRTGSCRPAAAGGTTTRPAAPGRAAAPPPPRKLCATVKELELWKNRNTLQYGSSGRAHHLTGIFHLTKTNQIREIVLLFAQSCNTQCKIMLVSGFFLPCHLEIIQPQLFPAVI